MSWYELRLRLKGYATVLTCGFAVFYGAQALRGVRHTDLTHSPHTIAASSAQSPADCECDNGC